MRLFLLIIIIKMNFDGLQISIEIKDLLFCLVQQKLEKTQKSNLNVQCFNNTQQIRKYQFKDKFTDKFPKLPMRRQRCCECLTQTVICSDCKNLYSSSCCQQMMEYVYDYYEWIKHKEDIRYKICYKCSKQLPKSRFSIDWRLIRLIEKMGSRQLQSKYFMHIVGNFLWLTKDNQLSYQKEKTIIKPSIFYQDHFGMFFCPTNDSKNKLKELGEYNSRYLQSLLKQNVKLAVTTKQEWEDSNLEQQCQKIIKKISGNQRMQRFKAQLQSTQDYNEFTNYPLSGQTKYIGFKQINNKYSFNSDILQKPDQYCHTSNPHIIFCFYWQYGVLLVKNANYETSTDFNNIRPIPIELNLKININWQMMRTAVWFKDRKGDIFSFIGANLILYKYHLLENKFYQIFIKEDQIFRQIIHQRQLLYIHQTNRVYYFNVMAFQKSFYIELVRNQKIKYTCEMVNIFKDSFTNCFIFPPMSMPCYTLYVIQTVTFERQHIKIKQFVPIIYFIFYNKQSVFSLPLEIRRLVQINNKKQAVCILQNILIEQSLYLNKRKLNNFDEGLFFPMSMWGTLKLFFYTVLEDKTTLIEFNLGNDIKIIEKKEKSNILSQKISWNHKYLQFSRKYNIPAIQYKTVFNLQKCSLLINDVTGINNNNSIRYLGYNNINGRIVEFMITNEQGQLQWKVYE